MSGAPPFADLCRPSRCTNCDVGGDSDEMQIGELQALPWAYIADAPSSLLLRPSPSKAPSGGMLSPDDNPTAGIEANLEEHPRKFVDGAYYTGQWLGDVRHGQGKLERSKWGSYEGQFVNGKASGSGHFVKVTGDVYHGQWLNDRANGHGHYVHCDGSTYTGQWDADLKSGQGRETWPDGSTYEGDFVYGMKHGHGFYRATDQSSFQGQFVDEMMDGDGKYVFADGRIYVGQWEVSRMSGDGTMEWSDGRKYVGQFKDDLKWGYGIFTWPEGRGYEGQWFRGKQHGQGVFIGRKGKRWAGEWENGKITNPTDPTVPVSACSSTSHPSIAADSRPLVLPTVKDENSVMQTSMAEAPPGQDQLLSDEALASDLRLLESRSSSKLQGGNGKVVPAVLIPRSKNGVLSYVVDIDGKEEAVISSGEA